MCNKHREHFMDVEGIGAYPINTFFYAKAEEDLVVFYTENGKKQFESPIGECGCAFEGLYNGAVIREHIGKSSVVEILEWEKASRVMVSEMKDYLEGTFFFANVIGDSVEFISKFGVPVGKTPLAPIAHEFKNRKKLMAVVLGIFEGKAVLQILRWADLHRHSGYSLLDGGSRIVDMVAKTDYAGALTDHGNMHGAIQYYKMMKKARKLPILGFEAYAETINSEKKGNHLLLLAKNNVGFQNLIKLTTLAAENFHRYPHISYNLLSDHREGLISTTTCMGSEVSQLLLKGKYDEAKYVAKTMADIIGKEDYYVELQRHGFQEEDIVNPQLLRLARELGLKVIGTTDSHYINEEDRMAQEILMCIGTKKKMADEDRMKFPGGGYHIHTVDEVEELFADIPEALDNTLEIAEKCTGLEIEFGNNHLPEFKVPEGFNSEIEYLRHISYQGFIKRFGKEPAVYDKEYAERLSFELDVIESMGFPGYFLIVEDFIRYAKENDIAVGPGRGSGAGSLVLYTLDITDVDPIPEGLLFERFLNPDRISMPDIDIDFADDRRDEVIEYVRGKYGERSVSRIITFGTLSAKAVSKDVARVLNKKVIGDKIAKAIPKTPGIKLATALKESPDLQELMEQEEAREVIELAMKLEGLPRHASIHACGVIITSGPVSNYVPELLMLDKDTGIKERTSQWTMGEVEEVGLLKMDFLGLRTMSVVANTQKTVNEQLAEKGLEPIKLLDIPLDDKAMYEEISKGNSYGVFQLESGGMRSFMKDLYADVPSMKTGSRELFERLVAGVSLYRPGPLDFIPDYIKNMKNPHLIQYDDPRLKPILEVTFGIIVYQEQTMKIVRSLAGFTKGEADNVRKAFAKKKADMIEPLRIQFMKGCIQNGITEEVAVRVWSKMESFASYAFNKSHASAYSRITVMAAYFKTHYPVAYMTATLNSYISKSDKLRIFLNVVKKMGIHILPPDVNRSQQKFSVEGNAIRFGLMGLKGLNKSSIALIREREENGLFTSMQDVVERMGERAKIDKAILESLVYSGGFDSFEGSRRAKHDMIQPLLEHLKVLKKEWKKFDADQLDIFGFMDAEDIAEMAMGEEIPMRDLPEMEKKFRLALEKEYAGFYLSEHPLDEYVSMFEREGIYEIGFLQEEEEPAPAEVEVEVGEETNEVSLGGLEDYDGMKIKIAGIVTEHEVFYTKRDQKPINVFQLEDHTGTIKCVVYDSDLKKNEDQLVEGKIVMLEGVVKIDDFGAQVIVNQMIDVEEMTRLENPKLVWVKSDEKWKVERLFQYITQNPGPVPVNVVYEGKAYRAKTNLNLTYSSFAELQGMFGQLVKIDY